MTGPRSPSLSGWARTKSRENWRAASRMATVACRWLRLPRLAPPDLVVRDQAGVWSFWRSIPSASSAAQGMLEVLFRKSNGEHAKKGSLSFFCQENLCSLVSYGTIFCLSVNHFLRAASFLETFSLWYAYLF